MERPGWFFLPALTGLIVLPVASVSLDNCQFGSHAQDRNRRNSWPSRVNAWLAHHLRVGPRANSVWTSGHTNVGGIPGLPGGLPTSCTPVRELSVPKMVANPLLKPRTHRKIRGLNPQPEPHGHHR